jgi:hypothetical protein
VLSLAAAIISARRGSDGAHTQRRASGSRSRDEALSLGLWVWEVSYELAWNSSADLDHGILAARQHLLFLGLLLQRYSAPAGFLPTMLGSPGPVRRRPSGFSRGGSMILIRPSCRLCVISCPQSSHRQVSFFTAWHFAFQDLWIEQYPVMHVHD